MTERALRLRLERWASRRLRLYGPDFADAYQSAWRKLLQGERDGHSVRNLELALRWAIHNSWLEECRRRRRRPVVLVDDPSSLPGRQASADPADQIAFAEILRTVAKGLHVSDARSAQVVFLRRVLGYSPDEVCDAVGITRRTYRSDHARGIRIMRERLAARADAIA